jgi:hypothetical protein
MRSSQKLGNRGIAAGGVSRIWPRSPTAHPGLASPVCSGAPLPAIAAKRSSQAAEVLEDAAEDLLAHFHFPAEHRRRLHSTNPLERLHKEVKRRTHVVGIFPDRRALLRLVGMLLSEQDDEWAVADRRYFSLESMRRLYEPEGGEAPGELVAAIA